MYSTGALPNIISMVKFKPQSAAGNRFFQSQLIEIIMNGVFKQI